MPRKVEVDNRFEVFSVDPLSENIGALKEYENEVEITIDSGAAKTVWPKKKRVQRK